MKGIVFAGRAGFTLVELLVVIAIMGLLGTMAVGGYRQMQRGMEDRSVMESANRFNLAAYMRARIDRRFTVVLLWNELLKEADDDGLEQEVVVGRGVAVRPYGRLTHISGGGSLLMDEFGDLNLTNEDEDEDDAGVSQGSGSGSGVEGRRLYLLDTVENGGSPRYSLVSEIPTSKSVQPSFVQEEPINPSMILWGFEVTDKGTANGQWKVGSLYGLEFEKIELPHGYIFGSRCNVTLNKPIEELSPLLFSPDGSKKPTVQISVLKSNSSGGLDPETVGTTVYPNFN